MSGDAGLVRFVEAQAGGVWERARDEVRRGRKTTHWMWFVFPQLAGLGLSPTARFYALRDGDEARAYLAQPVLGARLREAADLCTALEGRTATEVFGRPDDLKLRSCLTLFEAVAPQEPVFGRALDTLCAAERDARTLELLGPR